MCVARFREPDSVLSGLIPLYKEAEARVFNGASDATPDFGFQTRKEEVTISGGNKQINLTVVKPYFLSSLDIIRSFTS